MANRNKKIFALAMAMAMTVTSVPAYNLSIKAEQLDQNAAVSMQDISGIATSSDIQQGITEMAKNNLTAATREIDGVTYNNYCKYTGLTAKASSINGDGSLADNAIDGKIGSRWESTQGSDEQYLQVNLGNTYKIKDLLIYWEGASAKEYKVQISANGDDFENVTTVNSTLGARTDDIKFSSEVTARFIRIYGISRTTQYGYSIWEMGIYGSDAQKDEALIMSNLKIDNYVKYTGKYIVSFTEQADATSYKVFVDNKDNAIKTLKKPGCYLTANQLEGYAPGTHTMYIESYNAAGEKLSEVKKNFTITEDMAGTYTDIPQVYISSDSDVTRDYHKKADISVAIIDKDSGKNKDIFDCNTNMKIRGNSTAEASKKPWNIKLSSKEKVLGMDKGKKWCLLANAFDKSLLRNKFAYDFGLENGVAYTSQSRFVEVYFNGRYQGNYLMTEPVEAKSGRVETDAYNPDNNDILLELGTRYEDGVDHFTTGVLGTIFDVNDPEKGDDLTNEQVDAKIARVKAYLESFETALNGNNYEKIEKYIDVDTFVNFYIVSELFKNVDFNFSSTRFYIKRDEAGNDKIYAGPLWDFDLSSGNCKSSYYTKYYVDGVSYKGFYCQEMNWYKKLINNETFYNRIKQRYAELQYNIQNIYRADSTAELSFNNMINLYGKSFERNYKSKDELGAGWSLKAEQGDGYSYAQEANWNVWTDPVNFLRSWLADRNTWLCAEWNIDENKAYEQSKPKPTETTTQEAETSTKAAETTETPQTTEKATETSTKAAETTETPQTTEKAAETSTKAAETTETPQTTEKAAETSTKAAEITKGDTKNVTQVAVSEADKVISYNGKTKIAQVVKKKSAKKLSVVLKKVKGAKGYQISISTTKKFKKGKNTITKTFRKYKFVVKNLKTNKKYYIKARPYTYVNNKRTYGKWTKIKKIK